MRITIVDVRRLVTIALHATVAASIAAAATALHAAEGEVVTRVFLPAVKGVARSDATCSRALDIARVMSDDKLYRGLVGRDATTAQGFDSADAVLRRLREAPGDMGGLVHASAFGGEEQCESMCAVLPADAHIVSVRLSDNKDGPGVSILPAPEPIAPRPAAGDRPGSGSAGDTIAFSDYGYRGLQFGRGDRAVCVTARNWSRIDATVQSMRVTYTR